MQGNKYTSTIKDAEEGTKLRTIQAKLKDELIRLRLHNENRDESKEQSCLKYCSCNRVHQTAELISEKHKPLLFLLVILVPRKFKLPSQIDGIKTFSYIKTIPVMYHMRGTRACARVTTQWNHTSTLSCTYARRDCAHRGRCLDDWSRDDDDGTFAFSTRSQTPRPARATNPRDRRRRRCPRTPKPRVAVA